MADSERRGGLTTSRTHLSAAEARRTVLAAQGFGRPRPSGRVDVRHLRRVVRDLDLLQLDFVNRVIPAHYLVPFSRLGPYDRSRLDEMLYPRRRSRARSGSSPPELTEQWAHQASAVPPERWPLLTALGPHGDRRLRALDRFLEGYEDYALRVRDWVEDRGPLTAEDLEPPADPPPDRTRGWGWTPQKVALEAQLIRGSLAVVDRLPNLQRVYDLAERVIPHEHRERRVDRKIAQRELILRAVRCFGLGTAGDLAAYYEIPVKDARNHVAELAEEGAVEAVRVEGWREPAYLDPEARIPRRVEAAALLAPFDSLLWSRPRLKRLFHFDYRFEIFIPKSQRRWGTYVLPFLLDDRLAARVDLKAERQQRALRVEAAYLEPAVEDRSSGVASALAAELRLLAEWLNLDTVIVARRGDFAATLRRALGAR